MRTSTRVTLAFACVALLAATPPPATAGGYLWLGAEFQGEGNIYRFNLATQSIDMVQAHAGTDHWNNLATDDSSLYLGHPASNVLNRHDVHTGALITGGAYSASLAGHKEDGATWDGSLWRVTFSGSSILHRTTVAGVVETTFTGSNGGFVGIEWVQDTLFATTYNGRDIGTLDRTGPTTMAFTPRPWAAGQEPPYNHGALAYDEDAKTLYMATTSDRLYRVWFAGGEAFSELVVDLSTVGYPSGGLVDGMGWVRDPTVSVPAPRRTGGAVIELGAPRPNPARDAVWFELDLTRAMPVRVGIYDVAGRAQREWVLPGLGAGVSRFMWDFRGPDGQRVPAGRYFVRARSGEFEVSRAVVRVE